MNQDLKPAPLPFTYRYTNTYRHTHTDTHIQTHTHTDTHIQTLKAKLDLSFHDQRTQFMLSLTDVEVFAISDYFFVFLIKVILSPKC